MEIEKLKKVIEKIDALNSQDPNQEPVHDFFYPKELLYSQRLTEWVLKLEPNASEILRIAARGQHVKRWESPRDKYPMDRGGYLRWREDLKKFHAQIIGEVMKSEGYDDVSIGKVQEIILKKNIKSNPDTQTLEDALCLLFLETQFEELKEKIPDEKMIPIVKKTWTKMSERAHKIALSLPFKAHVKAFLEKALQ